MGTKSYTDQINNMIKAFDYLGVLDALPGPTDTLEFPSTLEVEDQHKPIAAAPVYKKGLPAHAATGVHGTDSNPHRLASADTVDVSNIDKVHRFPASRC